MAIAERREAADEEGIANYAEALRDRLMMYFQLHGLNHEAQARGCDQLRPQGRGHNRRILARSITFRDGRRQRPLRQCQPGKGPLSAALHRGTVATGISDALKQDTRDAARVQENLYMVNLADPRSGKVGVIPKTLAGLVPRMKASDYDYIIFDLPPSRKPAQPPR